MYANLKQWQDKDRFSEGRTPFYVPRAIKKAVTATNAEWVKEYQDRAVQVKALSMSLLSAWSAWDAIPVVKNRPEVHPLDLDMTSALLALRDALAWFGESNWNKGQSFRAARSADSYFTFGVHNAIQLLRDASQYSTCRDWTESSDAWIAIYSNS